MPGPPYPLVGVIEGIYGILPSKSWRVRIEILGLEVPFQ